MLGAAQVWAIGTGLVCDKETAQSVHAFIRGWLAKMYDQETADAVRIQYGGSVTPESVDELMAMPDIDGPPLPHSCRARAARAVRQPIGRGAGRRVL
jgi:hypothetical protein